MSRNIAASLKQFCKLPGRFAAMDGIRNKRRRRQHSSLVSLCVLSLSYKSIVIVATSVVHIVLYLRIQKTNVIRYIYTVVLIDPTYMYIIHHYIINV